MKIRNHRKKEWQFIAHKDSKLKKHFYLFKYKSDMMDFLERNFEEVLNGTISLNESSFVHSGCIREWQVWYNSYGFHNKGEKLKIVLKQLLFRGRKYVFKPSKISKESKKYFAFSDKVVSLMSNIYQPDGKTILPKDAKRLITLFEKRGFKDFEPTEEDLVYINGHISDGIQFNYWSYRCNFLRCKVILEYFKREGLIS